MTSVENIGNALLVIWASYWLYKDWHIMSIWAKVGFILLGIWALGTWSIVQTNKKIQSQYYEVLFELSATLRELRELLRNLQRRSKL